jgi:signal transduction histidine kinase
VAEFVERAETPGDSFMARLKDGRSLLYRAESIGEGGLVLTRIDLTDRLRLERERAEFRDQFHHAMKMEALGRLAGGIAHDFNNLLTAILTFAELLSQDLKDQPAQKRMADRIAGAALRAAGLVKQILGFSRKDMGDIREVDIGDVAKEALALLRATTPQSTLTSFRGEPGALVLADPGRISQVVMNLCVNARDAIGVRPGAIEIAVRYPAFDHGPPAGPAASAPAGVSSIAMQTSSDGRTHLMHVGSMAPDRPCVCLSIRDTGGGIPRKVLERMFEPFFTTKGVGQGSGLGLAAVHGIVLGLEGTIAVETIEGSGTTFRIFLPMARPPRSGAEPLTQSAGPQPASAA